MKVIVAIDDSPYSDYIVSAIRKRKWPSDTQFKILSVIEPINESSSPSENRRVKSIASQRHHHTEALCEKVRQLINTSVPDAIVHFEIREGQADAQILDCAASWKADRIIIGARGRQICPHNLLGSVSSSVSNHAGCTVEIIRSKQVVPAAM